MPFRDFQCDTCGQKEERFYRKLPEKIRRIRCACGELMRPLWPIPFLKTDSVLMAGSDDGFGTDERSRRMALAKARAAGVSTAGKRYCPQLCRRGKTLDPYAWYSDSNELLSKCRSAGKSIEGWFNVKAPVPDAPNPLDLPYKPAADVVDREVREVVQREHGGKVSAKKLQSLREAASERLAGNIGKKR